MTVLSAVEGSETSVPVIEGVLTCFFPEKGYGFAKAKGLPRDIMIRREVLAESGFDEIPAKGSRLACAFKEGPKGPFAERVLRISAKPEEPTDPEAFGPERLIVRFYRPEKDFGFFTRPDGKDVFLGGKVLRRAGLRPPETGDHLDVWYVPGEKSFVATKVALPS